jgi:hypothetical protein
VKEARKTKNQDVKNLEIDIQAIKKQLLKRKVELEEQMRQLHQDSLVIPDLVQDTGDKEQLVMQEILNVSLENNEYQEYNNVLAALARIDAGVWKLRRLWQFYYAQKTAIIPYSNTLLELSATTGRKSGLTSDLK